jgi:hypothetical protein
MGLKPWSLLRGSLLGGFGLDPDVVTPEWYNTWGALPYDDFVVLWNSEAARNTYHVDTDPLLSGGFALAMAEANAIPGMVDYGDAGAALTVLATVTAAACVAYGVNSLLTHDVFDFATAEIAFSSNFDWDRSYQDAIDKLLPLLGVGTAKILYRGTSFSRALSRTGLYQGVLWLSESLYYASWYAQADPFFRESRDLFGGVADASAISIYAILQSVLNNLVATGAVMVKYENGREYGFGPAEELFLVGPVVVPIPDNFSP